MKYTYDQKNLKQQKQKTNVRHSQSLFTLLLSNSGSCGHGTQSKHILYTTNMDKLPLHPLPLSPIQLNGLKYFATTSRILYFNCWHLVQLLVRLLRWKTSVTKKSHEARSSTKVGTQLGHSRDSAGTNL